MEFFGKLWLQVHEVEKIFEALVRAQRIKQWILTDSQHRSVRLKGSSYEALATGVDLHSETYVNPAHFAEAACPKIGRLYKPARVDW